MRNIIEIVKELQSTSSRLEKESILIREKDNNKWKKFLKYVLDPYYVYGLQEKKLKSF